MVIVTVIFNIIFSFQKSTLFQAQKPLISSMLCFYNHVCCSFLWFCFYIIRVKIKIFNKKPLGSIGDYSARIKKRFHFYLQKRAVVVVWSSGFDWNYSYFAIFITPYRVKRLKSPIQQIHTIQFPYLWVECIISTLIFSAVPHAYVSQAFLTNSI